MGGPNVLDDQSAEPHHRRRGGRSGREESDIFRKLIGWSLGLLLALCLLVGLQSTVLNWMA